MDYYKRGREIAAEVEWDGIAILEIAIAALEDANFHMEVAVLREMMSRLLAEIIPT